MRAVITGPYYKHHITPRSEFPFWRRAAMFLKGETEVVGFIICPKEEALYATVTHISDWAFDLTPPDLAILGDRAAPD